MSQRAAEIDIFLSYKREDRATAKALAEVLAARGYSLWWDIDLLPGDHFVDAVTEVIKRARITIVLWSKQAVASDYVRGEAEVARQGRKLLPARLDDCDVPIPFNALQTLDLRPWPASGDEAPLEPLVTTLEQRLGRSSKGAQPAEETDAKLHTRDNEASVWRSISDKHSISEYQYYLKAYPQGVFADLARMRIAALRKPDISKTILKFGGIAGAVAAIIGLVVLVREEFGPALDDLWLEPQQTATEADAVPSPADAEDGDIVAPTAGDTEAAQPYAPGDTFRDCDDCPEMVVVPAGSFLMGSPEGEEGRSDAEGPQHPVWFVDPFAIGVYEVTFDEWDACVADRGCNGYRPHDRGWGRGRRPVIYVSWDDAQAYVDWLSGETGEAYRLPSEAEWEYAARAGKTTRYWPGDYITQEYANFGMNMRKTIEVGSFGQPNAFGLHDVHGNVWEWVEDCWNGSYDGAPDDGTAWTSGDCDRRVLRGGSWVEDPRGLRSADRYRMMTDNRSHKVVGFRVARTLR